MRSRPEAASDGAADAAAMDPGVGDAIDSELEGGADGEQQATQVGPGYGSPIPSMQPADERTGEPAGVEEWRLDSEGERPGGAGADAEATFGSERLQGDPVLQRVLDGQGSLGPGATGVAVRRIQQALLDVGHGSGVSVTGTYDAATTTAVRSFQRARGISPTGVVASATVAALDRSFASHAPHATVARGHDRRRPAAGTRSLDAQDRTAINAALNPAPAIDPRTGQPPVFREVVGGQRFGDRLTALINAEVTSQYQGIGHGGHGDADRGRAGALYQWSSIETVADESKRVTDTVFGTYAQGPALRHATGQLQDRWEQQATAIQHAGPQQRLDIALWRVQKIINEGAAVSRLNREHGADLTRAAEKTIVHRIKAQIAQARIAELLEIHKGWPGAAGQGQIFLQRFAASSAAANRREFWQLFQTIIHEYLHTLTHSGYSRYAESLGDPRGHTLREGVTDVLTKTVWSTVAGAVTPQMRQRVEGPYHDPAAALALPALSTYPQTAQAEQVISVCGLHNMYAAYFRGDTRLIGGP